MTIFLELHLGMTSYPHLKRRSHTFYDRGMKRGWTLLNATLLSGVVKKKKATMMSTEAKLFNTDLSFVLLIHQSNWFTTIITYSKPPINEKTSLF